MEGWRRDTTLIQPFGYFRGGESLCIPVEHPLYHRGRLRIGNPSIEKDDWVIVPGAFEAIISQEIFDQVQAKIETAWPTRKLGPMKRRLFSRKLSFLNDKSGVGNDTIPAPTKPELETLAGQGFEIANFQHISRGKTAV